MSNTANKILPLTELMREVKTWKQSGQKVVFTNGVFDLLHLGHVDYLEKAAALGDRFVVALNSDASVKRLKGPERPLKDQITRSRVMAAMGFVDAVTLFDEDTPQKVIEGLVPDVLVKGGDYKIENIVGADVVLQHGGKVTTIPFVDGHSTTGIVEKMKRS